MIAASYTYNRKPGTQLGIVFNFHGKSFLLVGEL